MRRDRGNRGKVMTDVPIAAESYDNAFCDPIRPEPEPLRRFDARTSRNAQDAHVLSHTFNWSDDMKYLFVAMVAGAAALAGGSTANAANRDSGKQRAQESQSTDISAHRRNWHHRHHHWRHHHGYYRPHYRSYGYYPRHHGYYGGGPYGYYGGGPGVTFSFGGGRW
jgi:hypothetical protein